MYMFNTYQWDFPKVAALVAPRPLLLSNTDRDPIFPIEGVFRIYRQVRAVYDQMDAGNQFALNITAGPHHDSQELRVHAFRWFNHFLYEREDLIEKPAVKYFTPEQLRVFDEIPDDEINTRIDELFNPVAPAAEAVLDEMSWEKAKARWTEGLARVFKSWPQDVSPPALEPQETLTSSDEVLTTFVLQPDKYTALPLFRIRTGEGAGGKHTRLVILDEENWPRWAARMAAAFPGGHFWEDLPADNDLKAELEDELTAGEDLFLVSTRGAGPAKFSGDDKKQAMIRKRYYLLGQSLQTMQTWDILQAMRAIPDIKESYGSENVVVRANGLTAGMALYASLFADTRLSLRLTDLPVSHMQGPYYLRILRYMDMPAAVLMAGEKHAITLHSENATEKMQWEKVIKLADKFPQLSVRADLGNN
jgi:hypothetical protein